MHELFQNVDILYVRHSERIKRVRMIPKQLLLVFETYTVSSNML